jgi:hypothetical protein
MACKFTSSIGNSTAPILLSIHLARENSCLPEAKKTTVVNAVPALLPWRDAFALLTPATLDPFYMPAILP